MRPTVFGKQLVCRGKEFIGLNLGYNFYVEHEGDTLTLVQQLRLRKESLGLMKFLGASGAQLRAADKKFKEEQTVIKRFRACPYANYMVGKYTQYNKRKISIDNSSIVSKYGTLQTRNMEYVFLSIGSTFNTEDWNKRFGSRRKFTEEDFMYMPDYQHSSFMSNQGYMLRNGAKASSQFTCLCAAWSCSGDSLFFMLPAEYEWVVDGVVKALTSGTLAIVNQEPRLFNDYGCCLVDVEAAYRPRVV